MRLVCTPTLAEVLGYDGDESHVALSTQLLADTETPISAFHKLRGQASAGEGVRGSCSFLLESVEGGELMGRYSFMACGVRERFEFRDGRGVIVRGAEREEVSFSDPLDVVQERLRRWRVWTPEPLPRFHGGAVGYLGFDCVRYFEGSPLPPGPGSPLPPGPGSPLPAGPGSGRPEGVFLFADEIHVYDHLTHRVVSIVHVPLAGDRRAAYAAGVDRLEGAARRLEETSLPPRTLWRLGGAVAAPDPSGLDVKANRSREDFEAAVDRARESIAAGEVFQVVVSQRLSVAAAVEPFLLYRALRAQNPSPYMFFLDLDGFAVVGASPEVLVRLEGDELLLRPIAGTRPRGRDAAEDLALEAELLADQKELAEHRMLVDLGRNDVGRIARIGSVRVEDPLHVERYSHVMHIVSDVRGRLAEGLSAFDVLRACFPAGTVSGAPKHRACELLAELEPERRGLYAGAVGYFDVGGNMDTCIAIRTLLVEPDAVHVQAGAGIVHDSVAAREHEECWHKARSGLRAIQLALEHAQAAQAPGSAPQTAPQTAEEAP